MRAVRKSRSAPMRCSRISSSGHVDGAGQPAPEGVRFCRAGTDAVIKLARRQRPQIFALDALVIILQRHQHRHVGATSPAKPSCGGIQIALEKDIGDDRCSSTIGATMMISERPNNPRGRNRLRKTSQPRSGTNI